MSIRLFLVLLISGTTTLAQAQEESPSVAQEYPNVLWIFVEDLSPLFGSYGNKLNELRTPRIDQLAESGVLFERCYMPAPVCSPCRSAVITGAMQTTTGTHNHRSSRGTNVQISLPDKVDPLPKRLKDRGWFTFNKGKTDYNFSSPGNKAMFSAAPKGKAPWRGRAEGQPFFGQIQLRGGKWSYALEKGKRKIKSPTDLAAVSVPPYFPDIPLMRQAFALHHDTAVITDKEVGGILDRLEADGLLNTTAVFFFSDHGMNNSLRHKQFCYEGGVHVPLIAWIPERWRKFEAGARRSDLVSGLDITASTMALTGLELEPWVEGLNLFAKDHKPREFVISARDRCDYTIDGIRTVRTENYRYIRNLKTDRPWMQPQYRDTHKDVKQLRQMAAEGKLADLPGGFFNEMRPAEELYDMRSDPHQVHNLAGDEAFAKQLQEHRSILDDWMKETDDKGQYPESDASLRDVIARWKDKCTNPEYDALHGE